MPEHPMLEKTNRINLLFDFYSELLTEKQRTFLSCYFHDDYSLGEIASEFSISRQAVYEHIKRAELMLEEYERKLRLLAKHEQRTDCLNRLEDLLGEASPDLRSKAAPLLEKMRLVD
ncbi:putative DNA-binding protein [Chlamydia abortus]|uniref:UPF0122 protein ACFQ03_00090 n=1 Tax=Paenibacillus residui TaxID=629724 RepID=A0ABW3D579_9BACL|nr:putative DNA-binding protein [Chlamydia abortus]